MLLVLVVGSVTLPGCGSGGGGSSSGALCEQCGQSDGPCMDSVTLTDVTDAADIALLCPGKTSCDVKLACLRKLDSAQRRCFPATGVSGADQFRCDGERANRTTPTPSSTPVPTATPTLTSTVPQVTATGVTPTPTPAPVTPTPVPSATPVCGNGIVEGDEECDLSIADNINTNCLEPVCTCEDFCADTGGSLTCNTNCTFNFSQCTAGDCSF